MMTDIDKGREGNEVVETSIIRLDYGKFEKKSFFRCTLVYGGGLPPTFVNCDFIESAFVFEGPALHTTSFMASLANSSDEGRQLILTMLGLK